MFSRQLLLVMMAFDRFLKSSDYTFILQATTPIKLLHVEIHMQKTFMCQRNIAADVEMFLMCSTNIDQCAFL